MCSILPTPPLKIIGIEITFLIIFNNSISIPCLSPSLSIEVISNSPAPSFSASIAHSNTLSPDFSLPLS